MHLDYVVVNISSTTLMSTIFTTSDGSLPISGTQPSLTSMAGPSRQGYAMTTVTRDATTLRSMASRYDMTDSSLSTAFYNIRVGGQIFFNPAGGVYGANQNVEMHHCYRVGPSPLAHDLATQLPIPGTKPGEAAPLLVRPFGFTRKRITQGSAQLGDTNTMTVSFSVNADIQGSGAAIVISGLAGSKTTDAGGTTRLNPVTAVQKSMTVESIAKLGIDVHTYFMVDEEIMKCVSIAGNDITMERAQARARQARRGLRRPISRERRRGSISGAWQRGGGAQTYYCPASRTGEGGVVHAPNIFCYMQAFGGHYIINKKH